MARSKGSANLAASLEVLAGAPLDAREVVQAKADLTAQDSFPYKYIGLEVYVVAENKKYRLIGNDPTNIENWEEVGAGGSGGTSDYTELTNKPQIEGVTLSGNKSASDLGLALSSDITDDLADLNDDATHRLVTDTEKTAWNGKSTVGVTQIQSTGTKIATVNVDGTPTDLYAPSGGSGGTSDYSELENKPSIEGVTLSGNKTASDLGLDKARELTAAQYAALSEQEKMNGTTYFVTDGEGGGAYSIQKATLQASATTVTFTVPTTGDYLLNVYTSDGRNYTDVDLSVSGSVTLTFNAPSSNITIYLELKGV